MWQELQTERVVRKRRKVVEVREDSKAARNLAFIAESVRATFRNQKFNAYRAEATARKYSKVLDRLGNILREMQIAPALYFLAHCHLSSGNINPATLANDHALNQYAYWIEHVEGSGFLDDESLREHLDCIKTKVTLEKKADRIQVLIDGYFDGVTRMACALTDNPMIDEQLELLLHGQSYPSGFLVTNEFARQLYEQGLASKAMRQKMDEALDLLSRKDLFEMFRKGLAR